MDTNYDYSTLPDWFWPVMILAMLWTYFWKVLGLWHAAREKNKVWFLILMFVNTLGILEIYYIYGIAKIKSKKLFK